MKAYQCSRCGDIIDLDEHCQYSIGIDVRINHGEKGDAELCKNNFTELSENKQWHENSIGDNSHCKKITKKIWWVM